jgi:hypothetical protein
MPAAARLFWVEFPQPLLQLTHGNKLGPSQVSPFEFTRLADVDQVVALRVVFLQEGADLLGSHAGNGFEIFEYGQGAPPKKYEFRSQNPESRN